MKFLGGLVLYLRFVLWVCQCADEVGTPEAENASKNRTSAIPALDDNNQGASPRSSRKVAVTEVTFDSLVDDLVWCGPNHSIILLKTSSGRLYRSRDSGKTWDEITNSFNVANGKTNSFKADSVMVSPTDKSVVVVLGDSKIHYISSDAGRSFRLMGFHESVNLWLFHPTKASWALLSSWEGDCFSNDSQEDCVHSVFVTRDMGRTFTRVAKYVAQFSWGNIVHHSEDIIYFTKYGIKSGDQPKQDGWNSNISFMSTTDFGKSVTLLMQGGNKFLISEGYIFIAKVADAMRQTVNLYVSTDNGVTFNRAVLPVELEERSYTILDASEGAVIIHVGHSYEGNDVEVGNVYISDASGLKFSLSLPNNVRAATGECEFDKVYSLEGVYIANFRDETNGVANPFYKFKTHIEGTETQIEKKKSKRSAKIEPNIRTVVSFNKGGEWHYLKPPKLDSEGKPYDCDEGKCFLHLHGITQFKNFAPFYSVENAVGLVLATGNVGDRLRFNQSEVNTYLSRDGGLTWVEAHKGAFIYEFGDHGGLIVMAQDQRKTNEVIFSWNEGANWFDFALTKHDVSVNNIVIEPKASSLEFILYGNRNGVGVAFHLDFAGLGQPPCKGIWAIDSTSSDYETWTPKDPLGNECLLGKRVTYKRRKQASECFNGKDFKRTIDRDVCKCTRADYECEVGFARVIGSEVCKVEGTFLMREGCTSSSFFYTDAYRRIPGNVCLEGWVPTKVAVPCPPHSPLSKSSKAALSFILLLSFIMLIIVYISSNENLKHVFHNYGFKTFEHIAYSPLNARTAMQKTNQFGGKFEPEFGFIDAEQEHDDAPTLLSYLGDSHGARHKQDSNVVELL